MNASISPLPAPRPTFTELYTPKLVTILREGEATAAATLLQIKADP